MKHEDHIHYIDNLTALQDSEGKRISAATLGAIGRLYKASGGSLTRFAAMLKVARGTLLKELTLEVKKAQIQASKLGKDFGKQKLND